jgi:DNA-binding NtrC family response regulator
MQAKLLRVLESGELLRVGSLQAKSVDVHVVAATNRDLRAEVAAGRLRQDLLFRINMIEITLPPLRSRPEDVPEIAAAFLSRFARQMGKTVREFTPAAEAAMCAATWPGNVRELRNVVERACMVVDGDVIDIDDLRLAPPAAAASSVVAEGNSQANVGRPTLAVIEREHLVRAMRDAAGNKAKAADLLGISRRAFYRRLEKHGLDQTIQRRPLNDSLFAVA